MVDLILATVMVLCTVVGLGAAIVAGGGLCLYAVGKATLQIRAISRPRFRDVVRIATPAVLAVTACSAGLLCLGVLFLSLF